MSHFEDYSNVAKHYRTDAVGADLIAGLLHVYGSKPVKDLHVLDAGCGTGNYAKALIEFGVGKITLLDASKDMLEVAKEKLKDEIDKGVVDKVVEDKMPPLPFEDASFDVVLYSLTLHHVDHWSKTPGSEAAERAIVEAKRVLRPGGVLVIGEMLKSTIRESIWFMHLNDDLTARFSERFFTAEHILSMIEKAGFSCRTKLNVLGSDMFKNYWDPTGPLKDEWWKVSARGIYVMAKPEEIEAIKKFVQEKNDNGTMLEYMKKTDRTLERGSISFFISTLA